MLDQAEFTEHVAYDQALFKPLFSYSKLLGSTRRKVSEQSGFDLGER